MFGSCRKALSDVQECSGGPSECPGMVKGHLGCPGVVGCPTRMSGIGREALPDVQEWLGNPPGCPRGILEYPGVVGRPS